MVKCRLDRRDRAAVAVAEGLGWRVSHDGGDSVDVDLPSDWAADLAGLMQVFGEGVRRAAEAAGNRGGMGEGQGSE